jgi:hypothetical protein
MEQGEWLNILLDSRNIRLLQPAKTSDIGGKYSSSDSTGLIFWESANFLLCNYFVKLQKEQRLSPFVQFVEIGCGLGFSGLFLGDLLVGDGYFET